MDALWEPIDAAAHEGVGHSTREALVRYYSEAGPDYAAWSRNFNMHFGWWGWRVNPFDREAMLERMNQEVLDRLRLGRRSCRVLDLGCGLGATARSIAARHPRLRVTGVTIVPWQIEEARKLSPGWPIDFLEADYCRTPCSSDVFDGAYALESYCQAPKATKAGFLAEAFRVLKPGGRLVLVDCFRKVDTPMSDLVRRAYETACRCWVVEDFGLLQDVLGWLNEAGFDDVRVEDASWRIAPSVAHVPWVSVRFLMSEGLRGLSEQRRNNVLAPLLMGILGAARHRFGYYFITARKPTY